jgi:hypothetical protein
MKAVQSGQGLFIEQQKRFTAQAETAIDRKSRPMLGDINVESKFDGSFLDRPRISAPNWLPSRVGSNPKFSTWN